MDRDIFFVPCESMTKLNKEHRASKEIKLFTSDFSHLQINNYTSLVQFLLLERNGTEWKYSCLFLG